MWKKRAAKCRNGIENPAGKTGGARRQGDKTVVMEQLRAELDRNPDVWRTVGDLAKHAEVAWLDVLCGADLFAKECVQRELARLAGN